MPDNAITNDPSLLLKLRERVGRLSGRAQALALMACGGLSTFALAPFGLSPVMFVTVPALFLLADGFIGARTGFSAVKRGFAAGWCFGFGYFVLGLWWLAAALLQDAVHFAWAIPFAVLGFPTYLALYYGLALALAAPLFRWRSLRFLALALAIGLGEWLRGHVFTGFPWNALAYTAVPVPLLMQSVHIVGLFGLSALCVVVFAAPLMWLERRYLVFSVALALFVADIAYGGIRLWNAPASPPGKETIVRLVQPASDLASWGSLEGQQAAFSALIALSSAPPRGASRAPDIIVWPETALPFLIDDRADARTAIGEMLKSGQTLITGATRFAGRDGDGAPQFHNSIVVLNDDGQIVSASDKVHLVPFGEYLPFAKTLKALGLTFFSTIAGNYVPGVERNLLLLPDGTTLFPLVCYEAIFPGIVGAQSGLSDALLNVSFDSWFSGTPGPFQHFAEARLQAVAAGKPLIRVGENGVSAVVDAYGRTVGRLSFGEKGYLDVAVFIP
ncbi:apolipoprotein N-acyltransferase [Martelella sp. HB161492]|uniref:apolipoprotein N-acyltransferase n=1 Tax=Martelella sp. HB161492 TaxID=2720726 RepID=UPI001591964F|nr:apolipoprotein N-acyltransferase [Martelella sp. HB161492]